MAIKPITVFSEITSSKTSLKGFVKLLENNNCVDVIKSIRENYNSQLLYSDLILKEKDVSNCSEYISINEKVLANDITAVKLSIAIYSTYQYFIFIKENEVYKYAGSIKTTIKHDKPNLRIHRFSNDILYSVTDSTDSGTGLKDTDVIFYKLANIESSDIFSIKQEGYINGWGSSFNREYKSIIRKDKSGLLKVDYTVKYDLNVPYDQKPATLFNTKKTLLLQYNKNTFVMSSNSPSTFKEINDIMNHGEKYFCKAYNNQLKILSKSKDSRVKKWSQDMTKHCSQGTKNTEKPMFTVQAGVFNSKKNATDFLKKIKKPDANTEVYLRREASTNYIQVYIGNYSSISEANKVKSKFMLKNKQIEFTIKQLN